ENGSESCEIIIASDRPKFMRIPWELLRHPREDLPFCIAGAGLIRESLRTGINESNRVTSAPLRILMIIARPIGERDVPYRMIAASILDAIRESTNMVEVHVLRP